MIPYLNSQRVRGRRVLLRVDFNVPIRRGQAADVYDIKRALPTIQSLLRGGNTLILLSHHSDSGQSLRPLAAVLKRLLRRPVRFLTRPASTGARRTVLAARAGTVFLTENLRFWPGELANSSAFARQLARLGDVFVNDAFGEVHRPYASIIGIPRFRPSFAGPLIRTELKVLDLFRRRPRRPYIALVGGAKVSTKLPLLRRLISRADRVLAGGVVANVLLRAAGWPVGRSRIETGLIGFRRLARSRRLLLPVDVVVAKIGKSSRRRTVRVGDVARDETILDIGPQTRRLFVRTLLRAETIIWNGPMGPVEDRPYIRGTLAVARALARKPGLVLVGGGDTVAFLKSRGLLQRFRYVSTGGGAMLAYLGGEKLPGLEALRQSKSIGIN